MILQRELKKAEETNYDLMGVYKMFLFRVTAYPSSSECETAFNLIQYFR
jgi:hypothetical protein